MLEWIQQLSWAHALMLFYGTLIVVCVVGILRERRRLHDFMETELPPCRPLYVPQQRRDYK